MKTVANYWKERRLALGPKAEFAFEADDVGMSIGWRKSSTCKDLVAFLRALASMIEATAAEEGEATAAEESASSEPLESEVREHCGQCGAEVLGCHACEGVPGGFSDEAEDSTP